MATQNMCIEGIIIVKTGICMNVLEEFIASSNIFITVNFFENIDPRNVLGMINILDYFILFIACTVIIQSNKSKHANGYQYGDFGEM